MKKNTSLAFSLLESIHLAGLDAIDNSTEDQGGNLAALAANDAADILDALRLGEKELHLESLRDDGERIRRDGKRYGMGKDGKTLADLVAAVLEELGGAA